MKEKRIISVLLTLIMLFSTMAMNAVSADGNVLTLNIISPHGLNTTITIENTKTVGDLKNAVAEKSGVTFGDDSEYRLYNDVLDSPHYKLSDDTKILKDIGFASEQTICLEKSTYWESSEEQPIKIFGMTIVGGKGSQETFGDYTNVDFYWDYYYKTITVNEEAPIKISGTAEDGARIIINTGSSKWANLTVENITMTAEKSACITLNSQAQLNLTLEGTNSLTSNPGVEYGSTYNAPAIELCQSNSHLKINGNGSLTAISTCEGYPGIGTKSDDTNVKGVEINGGTVVSTGGIGIRAKRIWIYGGNVTANGGLSAKSAFKIQNATVTVNSDSQVFNGTLKPTLEDQYNAKASVNKDGTEAEKYDETKSNTYKYFTITPKTEVSLTVDEPQEYIYDGTAKSFKLPENILDGFSVAYKQGENDIVAPTNAGSYDVIITREEDDTYKSYSQTIENGLVIKPKTIGTEIILTAPIKNATPQTSIETDEYTATVVWSPEIAEGGSFANSTEYTATITITPKADYTTAGIAENGYTLDGATSVTNEADSNIVTAVFPKTAGNSGGGGGVTRYTIKFDTNGGDTITSQRVRKNGTATEPKAPTKDGYVFDGWYTDSKLTTEYDFDTKVTKNITLYAKWVEDEIQEPSDDKKDDNKDDEQKPTTDDRKNPFTDITSADWFFDNVRYANENGLMSGTTDTTFAPNDNLTRGMLVTVLYRAEGEPAVNKSIPFADVNASQYYANAVIWAEQNGIVKGVSETEFAPDENITREQIATIIYRYAEYKGIAPTGAWAIKLDYADVAEISDYAVEGVMYCTMKNIMQGKDNNMFSPKDNATRAEIAAILNRFIEGNK